MENLNYGIVGNCRSAALISKEGSLEWCCLPQFDSPSVFASLLDKEKGGHFRIQVGDAYTITQQYLRNTGILVTRYTHGADSFELHDFMPRYHRQEGGYHAPPDLIRYVKHISGTPVFRAQYEPRLEYALGTTTTVAKDDFIVSFTSRERFDTLFMYTSFSKEAIVKGEEIQLTEDGFFTISYNEKIFAPTVTSAHLEWSRTQVYWLNWTERTPHYRKYYDAIVRSAITLKMLSYDKTGAVLAAATTSLPETIGEVRNWDYRFCWIRDASMVIKVVTQLGHKNMARRFLNFIINLMPDKDEKLQIMYGINSEKELTEFTLDHLSGYENSKPVRVGNAAFMQQQNDIYGILMDVIYQQFSIFKTDIENSEELWSITKAIVWVVDKHWQEPDKGIWEFRTEERHFTFSKVLCWVAVDKAIRVAQLLGKTKKMERWRQLETEIREEILANAWSEKQQAFTQSYGSDDMDASVLLMEPYGFLDAHDPRYVKTVEAVERELSNGGLLYRYKNKDDFGLPSSSFTICTFWFINALYKIGEKEKAMQWFDRLLGYSNHLMLFSEDIDFKTKRLLGNFPQAYSHLALIETAINLSEYLTGEDRIREQILSKESTSWKESPSDR